MNGTLPTALGGGQYLSFLLGRELFGVEISCIREIIEFGRITRVPLVPDTIRGVINLRGNVVPVIDLNVRLGGNVSRLNKRTAIVIIELPLEDAQTTTVGIMVDLVNEVLDLEEESLAPPLQFGAGIRHEFIAGLARRGESVMMLLDIHGVLALEELAAFEAAVPGTAEAP